MQSFETIIRHYENTIVPRLSPLLSYHNMDHVKDVVEQSQRIGREEQVNAEDLFLISCAALYHDSGFITLYKGHEEVSCRLAEEHLPRFGIRPEQMRKIRGMIMATRVPQYPQNLLERIICDADLDYLGRDDFFEISERLFREMMAYKFISSHKEWDELQQQFFRMHRYFTLSNGMLRNPRKEEHLEQITERLASCPPL